MRLCQLRARRGFYRQKAGDLFPSGLYRRHRNFTGSIGFRKPVSGLYRRWGILKSKPFSHPAPKINSKNIDISGARQVTTVPNKFAKRFDHAYYNVMSCSYCELCPSVPSGPGTVFLQSPQPLIKAKVEQALAGATNGEVTSIDQAFFVPSFTEFLSSLLQFSAWTALEKQDTILLFTPGSSFALSPNVEIRTLARWESLTNAGFLIDILSNNRLVSHFHPIWDLPRQTLFGYECLIRGQEANGALIPPSRLFGAAQENRLLFNLDRQARQSALRSAARFPVQTKLFINFVPTAIYDPIFCLESTVGLAHQLGITPDRVVFEVIETEEVDDWNHLEKILTFYRKNGFQIALDDVGSGYSSLNRLVQIRPDIIKIDLEIIRDIESDPVKQSVFRALATIARENGIKLLAEGVETSEELAFVTNEGADLAQGYLWGPPSAELGVPQFEVHP